MQARCQPLSSSVRGDFSRIPWQFPVGNATVIFKAGPPSDPKMEQLTRSPVWIGREFGYPYFRYWG
jgi:hypothetical protein